MRRSLVILGLIVAGSGTALAAGQVEVSFKPVDQLSDIGRGSLDGERNVQALAAHFKSLGARLADGQTLKIEVLDVDMAGEMKPLRRGGEVRVLKGAADWPTITLRWTLQADGRTLGSGDERISDMSYLMHVPRARQDGALVYEQRLIDSYISQVGSQN